MFAYLMAWLNTYMSDEEGQGMAEYGLILVLIALVVIVGMGLLGTNLDTFFNTIAGEFAAPETP